MSIDYPVGRNVKLYLSSSKSSGLFSSLLALLAVVVPGVSSAQTPVLTQHNNNSRTGAYTTETILTPANVNQNNFGKVFSYPVDGRIYAQPLYVPNVTIPGKGTHNVIFIATEHDSVYAFDADSNGGANASPLWKITLLDAAHGATAGATTVPNSDISSQDLVPEIGITSTPVIDLNTNTIYVVGKTKEGPAGNPTYVQRLHALDITTGAEKFGGPRTISGSVNGTGNGSVGGVLTFDPKWQLNRPGLLLQNGIVYIAFGSHGDNGPWHGWIFAYNAATLQQTSIFCTTSNSSGSGIWMSGTGLAADIVDPVNKPYGRMFVPTGNGTFNAAPPYTNSMSYGDDMMRMDLSNGVMTVQDSFTPFNQSDLRARDADLASGGILLLPDQSAGGHTHLMAQAGKDGTLYLVDRDNMGGFNSSTDNIVQEIVGQTGGLWSAPALWNNTLYTWGKLNFVQAFSLTNGKLSTTPVATSPVLSNYPGATPSVSANGNSNGIVWAIRTENYSSGGSAVLHAFNASNVATELYNSTQNVARDAAGLANKFAVPTIANGKVYVGTATELDIYGLLNAPTTATPVISPAGQSFSGTLTVTITDSTAGAIIYYTTDGSAPTSTSTVYSGPISVSTSQIITAIGSATGFLQSPSASQTYTLQNQVAAPGFSPASMNFSSPISVTLSDATAGARIYYTTDGSTPTTSSALYSTPVTISATTTTLKAMAAVTGMINSNVSTATYTYVPSSGGTGSNFINGFSTAQSTMTFNGSTGLADTRLQLTDGGTYEAASAWFNTRVNIQAFTNDFTFQIANPGADGFTFTIQNAGLNAIGGYGGGLGYGQGNCGATTGGIGSSIAIKFDIYDNCGEGINSTGLYINGVSPTTPAISMSSGGINLSSGSTFSVHMVYDGTTLTMTITDGVTNASFTNSWQVSIPQIVGSNTAFVGFTGGTGGLSASQKIETWNFNPTTSSPSQTATPTFSPAAGTYLGTQTVSISDSTSGASIFYTTDGSTPATSAGGSTLQYSGPITVAATQTIKAVATASGYSASNVATATYTIQSQVAAPTFTPAGGSYSSTQTVAISSATAGASIYYTLDGSTPTTSSAAYSAPISIATTTTVKAIAAKSGFVTSGVSTAAYTIAGGGSGTINFAGGFAAGGMIFNGSTVLNGSRLRLTDGGAYEAASAWYNTQVSTTSFTNDFSFQVTPSGINTADGFAFVIQANNTSALGPVGGGLGYGPGTAGATAANSILNSVAVKFDLYNNSGETGDSTGIYTNGASPTTPYVDLTNSGIDVHSGHVFNVHMTYDGTNLVMAITDATTAAVFTQTWPINIPSVIGSSNAYAGFTGGTGGLTSIQEVISWTYSSGGTTPTAATPTFSPAGGTYTSAQSVTLSDATAGASIYYTTDGSTPTTGSTKYTGTISVGATTTIKAIAAASGYNNSSLASATYTIQLPAATPTFSPAAGTYTSAQSVTISDATAGATIYYTTNGATPTTASTQYTGPVNVGASATLKAIATAPGFSTSAVGSAAYTINLPTAATPTFTPAAGTYTTTQSVTISDSTAGAAIYYTTDGSTPTISSTRYTTPISVAASLTIKAIAVASGFSNSAVGSAAYVIQTGTAATPTFSPAGGTYASAQNVTISTTTPNATIYYTTDGSTPTKQSTKYTAPVTISTTTTLKAIATTPSLNNSAVASATYTIQTAAATPTFSPAPGTYTGAQSVTLSDTTAGASIYYTTDGSTPTAASTKYTAPIAVSTTTTIKAIAIASGFNNSAVATGTYTIGAASAISFGSGFSSSAGLQFNGGATTSGTRLRVTDGGGYEARSVFWTTPVNVQSFTTDFTFQQAPGSNPTGDGLAFVLQNVSPTALGPYGGGLGYGPGAAGQTGGGIGDSIAIKFDLYDNSGEGVNSTGLYTNGASPTTPSVDLTASGVNLHLGSIMRAHATYDGTTLVLTITDTSSGISFSNSWNVNIPTTINSSTAYAGFTGGTGGVTAVQDIITWTYSSGAPKPPVSFATTSLPATTSGPPLAPFTYSGFPDGTGMLFSSTGVGDSVTFTVNVPQAGVYDIVYTTQKAANRGYLQFSINGTNVGPQSGQYATTSAFARCDLGNFTFPAAGSYSFKFTVMGRNASSSGYSLAFDDIILTPQ